MPRPRNRCSARNAGTRWESAVVDFLQDEGFPNVERRAKAGARDKGDIAGLPCVIECKNTRTVTLASAVAEAKSEALNADEKIGVVWMKRQGRPSAGDGYVIMDGVTFVEILHKLRSSIY